MTTITFTVSGEPKGQPRPRAFARKMGDRFVARVYDAGTAEGWKSQIALEARPHIPAAPLAGAISLSLHFVMPRPKKHFLGNNPARGLRPDAPRYHTGKPDKDNLEKAVMDCFTRLGFWGDDSQVVAGTFSKTYGATPGCRIELRLIQEDAA